MTVTGRSIALRWGLLATGAIAEEFADGLARTARARLVAVGSRDGARARAFGARHGVDPDRCHGSYEELLADPGVDIVYVSTPHTEHARWTIAAVRAGRHVLCEKPLTMTAAEAKAVVEEARRADVFLMEAFMYRFHPLTTTLASMVEAGRVGDVRAVEVAFGFEAGPATPRRVTARALGGGGILDVGCYAVSVARLVAGAARGAAAIEPDEVVGRARFDPVERVDVAAYGVLGFPGDILAQVSCSLDTPMSRITVHGAEGRIDVPVPPWRLRGPGAAEIVVTGPGGMTERVSVRARRSLMEREAEVVADHLHMGQVPEMSWAESVANMRTLDRWREAVGLDYGGV